MVGSWCLNQSSILEIVSARKFLLFLFSLMYIYLLSLIFAVSIIAIKNADWASFARTVLQPIISNQSFNSSHLDRIAFVMSHGFASSMVLRSLKFMLHSLTLYGSILLVKVLLCFEWEACIGGDTCCMIDSTHVLVSLENGQVFPILNWTTTAFHQISLTFSIFIATHGWGLPVN